jgi:hypothetical protein
VDAWAGPFRPAGWALELEYWQTVLSALSRPDAIENCAKGCGYFTTGIRLYRVAEGVRYPPVRTSRQCLTPQSRRTGGILGMAGKSLLAGQSDRMTK